MEQLLEKQGDGEAGVNSEEGWSRAGRPALGPPNSVTSFFKVPKLFKAPPLGSAPALTLGYPGPDIYLARPRTWTRHLRTPPSAPAASSPLPYCAPTSSGRLRSGSQP